jgi:hypothetical protein
MQRKDGPDVRAVRVQAINLFVCVVGGFAAQLERGEANALFRQQASDHAFSPKPVSSKRREFVIACQ